MRYFIPWICSAMMLSTAAFGDAAPPPDTRQQLRELYFDAARTGSTDRLGAFIEAHYDLDTRDESGYTALILAAYHGQTAAMYAALFQRKDILEALAAKGADLDAQDDRGNDARSLEQGRFSSGPLR